MKRKEENIWEIKARTQPLSRIIAGIGSEERHLIEDAKQVTKILKKKLNLGRKIKILDIGTGPLARFAIEFAQLGCSTIGIDISRTTIKNAKARALTYVKKRKISFLPADLNTLPFKNGFFDVVFCAGTFYHVPKKRMINALREMNRVLKQNSKLYIDFPSRSYLINWQGALYSILYRLVKGRKHPVTTELLFYSEVKKMLEIAGFSISSIDGIYHLNLLFLIHPKLKHLNEILSRRISPFFQKFFGTKYCGYYMLIATKYKNFK